MRTSTIIVVSVLIIVSGFFLLYGLREGDVEEASRAPESPATTASRQEAVEPAVPARSAVPPTFDVVRVSREGTGVIAGRAEPHSDVVVKAGNSVIGSAAANKNGEWVLIFQKPLDPGSQKLTLQAQRGDRAPVVSDDVVVISVPQREETRFAPGADEGVVAVLSPRDGSGPSKVLQKPGQIKNGPLENLLTVDTLDYDGSGRAIMTGRAQPGSKIRLYLDNQFLDTVTADDSGEWQFMPESTIAAGEHVLRLDQMLEGDDVRLRIEQPFNRTKPLDTTLAEGQVEVQPGNSLWHIARRVYGAGILYTVIFKENKNQIRDPDLIYPDQLFRLPSAESAVSNDAVN